MHQIIASSGDEAYLKLLDALRRYGTHVSPRGEPTRELLDATVQISFPELAAPLSARPGVNTSIAATETVHLLGGMSSLDQLDAASNGRFNRYADDGRLLGAYGPRLDGQLDRIIDQLRLDPDTRQAVAVIWNRDEYVTRDTPCTVALTFRVRQERLGLKVHMRSNDAWLGVPYDWTMFSRLQLAVAEVLNFRPGAYVHHADSLHLYERDAERAEAALSRPAPSVVRRTVPTFSRITLSDGGFRGDRFEEWADVRSVARRVAFHMVDLSHPLGENLSWYAHRVPEPPAEHVLCAACGYVVPEKRAHRERIGAPGDGNAFILSAPVCDVCRA